MRYRMRKMWGLLGMLVASIAAPVAGQGLPASRANSGSFAPNFAANGQNDSWANRGNAAQPFGNTAPQFGNAAPQFGNTATQFGTTAPNFANPGQFNANLDNPSQFGTGGVGGGRTAAWGAADNRGGVRPSTDWNASGATGGSVAGRRSGNLGRSANTWSDTGRSTVFTADAQADAGRASLGAPLGTNGGASALPLDLADEPINYRVTPTQVQTPSPVAPPTPMVRTADGGVSGAPWTGGGTGRPNTGRPNTGNPATGNGNAGDPANAGYGNGYGYGSGDPTGEQRESNRPEYDANAPGVTMWIALLAGLFFSLCANAYFIWQAWETHNRYEDLVSELAEDRGSAGGGPRRRFREARVFGDEDSDRMGSRSRDDSLNVA